MATTQSLEHEYSKHISKITQYHYKRYNKIKFQIHTVLANEINACLT